MPIYEYECKGCGKVFEIYQKMGDDPLKVCRVCNGELVKLISNCAFHLKGSGWYVTDYKKPVDHAKASSAGSASGNGQKEDKTETKEAATTEPAIPKESVTTTTAPAETKSVTTTT